MRITRGPSVFFFIYSATVKINGKYYERGDGSSKKEAKSEAARKTLKFFKKRASPEARGSDAANIAGNSSEEIESRIVEVSRNYQIFS